MAQEQLASIVTIKAGAKRKAPKLDGYLQIDTISWTGRYKELSPYYLKTDGEEEYSNPGGIIFENYWQASKYYPRIYFNKVYPSQWHKDKEEYLKWCSPFEGLNTREKYFIWRDSLWNCNYPIRYPNTYHGRHEVEYSLYIDRDGNEQQLNYIDARREIYFKEFARLVRNTRTYQSLLGKFTSNQNIQLVEIDVPTGDGCDENGNCFMTRYKIEQLLEDPTRPFGHSLVISYCLLEDCNNF